MKELLAELFDRYHQDVYTYLYSLCHDVSCRGSDLRSLCGGGPVYCRLPWEIRHQNMDVFHRQASVVPASPQKETSDPNGEPPRPV